MIAPHGGSIAVKPNDDPDAPNEDQSEYCKPRFKAIAILDPASAEQLFVGERGFAVVSTTRESLGQWLVSRSQKWLETQLELVQPAG